MKANTSTDQKFDEVKMMREILIKLTRKQKE